MEENMADQEQVILDVMKKLGKPMKAGDIAEVVGIDKEAVSKTIKELKKKGLVDSPKACFYVPVGK
jgi:Mn-dependent DtxR family transcriptional regulator